MAEKTIKLGELHKGGAGIITRVGRDEDDAACVSRLLEMGLLEGSHVEVFHEAPFGKDPIAVKVRGSLVALRRNEANAIEVTVL